MLTLMIQSALSLFTALHPPPSDGDRRDRPPPPPAEAIEVCEGAAAGDACSFSGRDGETLSGQCWRPSAEVPLACRPDDAPRLI